MNSTMAQKYEFNRYKNEFHSSYDTRNNPYASHRDTRMFQNRYSNIICFRFGFLIVKVWKFHT